MRRGVAATICLIVTCAIPWRAVAEEATEQRFRLLEEQLKQALARLDEQQKLTQEQQREITELRREVKEARAARRGAPAPAGAEAVTKVPPSELQRQIDERVRSEVARAQEQQRAIAAAREQANAELEKKVEELHASWADYADRWMKKVKLGTLFYGDWAFYEKTGFGPQFLTQINPPGPGNDNFNSFDITRAYINLFFTPTDDLTFRVTPNIFRANGSPSATKTGKSGGINTNLDGELSYRLKYAYVDFNTPFKHLKEYIPAVEPLSEDKITFGQQQNPLIDWEESLYGYRFVNLVPWNYLSLSSTQAGLAMKGPIKFNNEQFVEYDLGIYNNSSFSQREQSETKQGMARVSYYPFGARSRFDGFGIPGFYDYGYPNKPPDSGVEQHISRVAGLLHYSTDWWSVAGEYDQGHNAFSSNNLFSGSGPADQFGVGPTPFKAFDSMVKAIQDNQSTTQQGFDVFGHVDIPSTPLSVFGLYQWFLPNTKVDKNPLDFQRYVAGVGYKYNKYLRFAVDVQTLDYFHDQFTFPASFGLKKPVKDAVPDGIRAVFMNVEFNY